MPPPNPSISRVATLSKMSSGDLVEVESPVRAAGAAIRPADVARKLVV